MELVDCPECGNPAEVTDRRTFKDASPGPVEIVRIDCINRHWFSGTPEGLGLG